MSDIHSRPSADTLARLLTVRLVSEKEPLSPDIRRSLSEALNAIIDSDTDVPLTTIEKAITTQTLRLTIPHERWKQQITTILEQHSMPHKWQPGDRECIVHIMSMDHITIIRSLREKHGNIVTITKMDADTKE